MSRLYRKPDISMGHDPRHISAALTSRLLAFLARLNLKNMVGIKSSDLSFFVERMNEKTK